MVPDWGFKNVQLDITEDTKMPPNCETIIGAEITGGLGVA